AVGVGDACGGLQSLEQVLPEERIGVRLVGVPSGGVPGTTAVVVLAPGDRVVLAHRVAAWVVGVLVEGSQHVHVAPRVFLKRVPLIEAFPLRRQMRRGGMSRVFDHDRCVLLGGVTGEVGTDQVAVPGPVVFGVAGGVHAGIAATVLDRKSVV